jgi:hypothetical protein|tara:strand:+ start:4251 stop:4649 length:399 start_codon:yes stop_codon:yes gene_type:complete
MNQESIDRALNVKAKIVKETPKKIKDTPQDDFEYSRGQLYNLVEKGQEAIDGIMDVCQDSQHPRAYEVAGQLIKSVGDVTDKLLDLQKKMKDIEKPQKSGPNTVNNALFVGSTSELQKILKKGILNNDAEEK